MTIEKTAWDEIKQKGSDHYKHTDDIEPIDLYRSGGLLKAYAITSIIKYAYRNRNKPINEKDIDKLLHCGEMLKFLAREGE